MNREDEATGRECADTGELTCREAIERIYEFMDGEATDVDPTAIAQHFEKCAACYPHLALEQNFRAKVAAAIQRQECPDALRKRVLTILEGE